jgi:hypothetical protein
MVLLPRKVARCTTCCRILTYGYRLLLELEDLDRTDQSEKEAIDFLGSWLYPRAYFHSIDMI